MITELEFWQKVKEETWKRIKLFLRLQNPNNQLPQFAQSLKNKECFIDWKLYHIEKQFMAFREAILFQKIFQYGGFYDPTKEEWEVIEKQVLEREEFKDYNPHATK